MGRWNSDVRVEHPGRASAGLVRLARWLAPLVRVLHRPTLEGVQNLPTSGPYLLVANHSAGLGLAELGTITALYLTEVGPERPLAGFAHPLSFGIFPLSTFLRHAGAIPSTYEAAKAALAAGVPILVFPGGDHETMRPLSQAFRVDFGGRKGFLRIARASGVPVVPLGIRGGHFTAPILFRSTRLLPYGLVVPRLLGLKRWGLSLLGLLGAVAIATLVPLAWPWRAALVWLWLGSPLVFLPWVPWTLRLRIGAPIPAAELFGDEDDTLDRALARVEQDVQRLVDGT